jgi:hypothetical protein
LAFFGERCLFFSALEGYEAILFKYQAKSMSSYAKTVKAIILDMHLRNLN